MNAFKFQLDKYTPQMHSVSQLYNEHQRSVAGRCGKETQAKYAPATLALPPAETREPDRKDQDEAERRGDDNPVDKHRIERGGVYKPP